VRVKIAIPLFKERVSPHFGSSSKFLLVETSESGICQEVTWDLDGESAMDMAQRLVALGVNKVVCGGIQYHYKNWLISKGITVVDNQKGVAREIIRKLLGSKG